MFKKKSKKYRVAISMGHDTNTEKFYDVEARDKQQAYFRVVSQYEAEIGKERLKEIFNSKGLPMGYSPYSVIKAI